jgi:hypothetical protein
MGPPGSAARPAKKNESVELRPIPHVHACYGRPSPKGEGVPAAVLGSCRRVVDDRGEGLLMMRRRWYNSYGGVANIKNFLELANAQKFFTKKDPLLA